MMSDDRGVSPVIGAVLIVAIVVALAAATGLLVTDLGSEKVENTQAGPYFGTSVDTAVEEPTGCGAGDSMLTLTHTGGEPVPVEDLEIQIIAGGSELRMVDLPMTGTDYGGFTVPNSNHFEGNEDLMWSLIHEGCAKGPFLNRTDSDTLGAGDEIGFITGSDIDSGDTITIRLIDVEQNAIVVEEQVQITS